jgi:NADPH-ferrihemoprotein reductase
LGLYEKKDTVINIESLDPALAKVPFPIPTTYGTVLRHYIDISALASRQTLGSLAKYAPTPEAEALMKEVSANKEAYSSIIAAGCMKLGEALQYAAGNDLKAVPNTSNTTAWKIPFDVIVSAIPRLQPRYYSISSSPKLNPNTIHATVVVLKYESEQANNINPRWVYGVGSNFLLNLKYAANHENVPLISDDAKPEPSLVSYPKYAIEGPRGAYKEGTIIKAPIHVRRSTFRLPTNPKSPVIMIGPGTVSLSFCSDSFFSSNSHSQGVAPFRGFVQERVAMARRTIEKNGPEGLADWGTIRLYFGCRRSDQDFLYSNEWPEYAAELKGKFIMRTAFSREPPYKPDGSKIYVQDLIWEDAEQIADAVLNGKGYVYICGDAKAMSKSVEEILCKILGEAKGGSAEVEGAAELKLLKERNRLLLDVWS